jgi:hypothetical protein
VYETVLLQIERCTEYFITVVRFNSFFSSM